MKLRLLELTNVRRFAGQTATLGPIHDGLTTITAENEAGKSTFFDALHALFFTAHGSKAQDIKALQPYSGGAVTIAAAIEIDAKSYRIEKTFLSTPSARITDQSTGQVIKQQGDAEAWIEDQINSTRKGPAGLLWVRQGEAHIDPTTKGKDADNIAARRDLMSSVRGQIDAVTGGRRMDKIAERCRREFDALSQKGIKAKAGSPWKQVEDDIAQLSSEKEKLTEDVAKLSQALKTKTRATARLRELQSLKKQGDLSAQIDAATTALEEAKHHAQQIAQADQAVQLVQAVHSRITREIDDIVQMQIRRQILADKIAEIRRHAVSAGEARQSAEKALREVRQKITEEETARRRLEGDLKQAAEAQRQAEKWLELHRTAALLQQIAEPQRKLAEAQALLDSPDIGETDVEQLTDLSRRISIAKEQRRAHFASVTFNPTGDSTARIDGTAPPTAEPVLIDRPLKVELDGYGTMTLQPAQGAGLDIDDPDRLQTDLTNRLETLGFETLAEARTALTQRQQAQNAIQIAQAEIRGLAPEGAAALRIDYETLCAALGHVPGTPLPKPDDTVDQTAQTIEARIAQIDTTLETLRPEAATYQQTAMQATTTEATANGVLAHQLEEQDSIPAPADEATVLARLETELRETTASAAKAEKSAAQLRGDGPNLTAAQATHDRLRNVEKANRDEIDTLRRTLAHADGAIEAQSEGAVEEKLAAATDALEKATARSARYEMQARALRLLIDHLDAARKDAQDAYFEPIRAELHPLLAQLHAGAAFELDPDKMLVDKIIRNGVSDDITVLSGGAYEQIAILTRLAFARLFAKQGRHVPVILDDALVHTDDERIATMFNMLSQVAKDQQIIVLSCRTRAFSDLGGTRAVIDVR